MNKGCAAGSLTALRSILVALAFSWQMVSMLDLMRLRGLDCVTDITDTYKQQNQKVVLRHNMERQLIK